MCNEYFRRYKTPNWEKASDCTLSRERWQPIFAVKIRNILPENSVEAFTNKRSSVQLWFNAASWRPHFSSQLDTPFFRSLDGTATACLRAHDTKRLPKMKLFALIVVMPPMTHANPALHCT